MRSSRSEPYLWVHLAGIVAVPLCLELCLLGLAAGESFLPSSLVFLLVAVVGIAPVAWMQWHRPFNIFSLMILALKPNELTETQRRILQRFKSPLGRIITVLTAIAALVLLWQLNRWVPLVTSQARLVPGGALGGLGLAAGSFLFGNLFLQVPASVLPVLLTPDEQLAMTDPYPVLQISKDFTLVGIRVSKILPPVVSDTPPVKAPESSLDQPAEEEVSAAKADLKEEEGEWTQAELEAEVATGEEQTERIEPELEGEEITDEEEWTQSDVEADQVDADQLEADQAEADQVKADQVEVAQAEADQAEVDQVEVDQLEASQAEVDQAEVDQVEVDQAEADQVEVDQADLEVEEPIELVDNSVETVVELTVEPIAVEPLSLELQNLEATESQNLEESVAVSVEALVEMQAGQEILEDTLEESLEATPQEPLESPTHVTAESHPEPHSDSQAEQMHPASLESEHLEDRSEEPESLENPAPNVVDPINAIELPSPSEAELPIEEDELPTDPSDHPEAESAALADTTDPDFSPEKPG